jgi:DNA adenine methylase
MKPFLNWAGGKRWLVANHAAMLNAPCNRLIEPFLGSGAVYFHLEPNKALLADANPRLIEAFAAVRDEPTEVLEYLMVHQSRHDSDYYYRVREQRLRKRATRAAQFIYLNRTCFNGLYRVNLNGRFNVPKGSKDAVLLPDDDFLGWSKLLRGAQLRVGDFAESIGEAGPGDLLYVDPPYTVKHNMNNFVKYNERIFSWADQIRLRDALVAATGRGARVILSNADHASDWAKTTLGRHSRLAASSDHRKPTTELVISSCLA